MNQVTYSTLVLNHLEQNHPEFLPTLVFDESGAFSCHIMSPGESMQLIIKTIGCLITLELDPQDGLFAWHTHMSLVGANMPEDRLTANEELSELTRYLNALFSGSALIAFDEEGEFYISEDQEFDLANLRASQQLQFMTWSNL